MPLQHGHWTNALPAALGRRVTLTRAGAAPLVAEWLGASPERLFRETVERVGRRPPDPSLN
jgi:hypothetical protein